MNLSDTNKKQVTMLLKNPNPLFSKWLTEWRDQALQKGSKNARSINFALSNLKKYKLPLESGQECKILKGFGDKLCQMLDKRLQEHKKEAINVSHSKDNNSEGTLRDGLNQNDIEKKNPNEKKTRHKQYIPQKNSAAYAILLALYNKNLGMNIMFTKAEIIQETKHYSQLYVWPSMQTLLKNELINKSNTELYCLTEKGYKIAQQLLQTKNQQTNNSSNNMEPTSSCPTTLHQNSLLQRQNISSNISNILNEADEQNCIDKRFLNEENASKHNFVETPLKLGKTTTLKRHVSTSSLPSSTKKPTKALKRYASSSVTSQNSDGKQCFIFQPESFDIVLYIDTAETNG